MEPCFAEGNVPEAESCGSLRHIRCDPCGLAAGIGLPHTAQVGSVSVSLSCDNHGMDQGTATVIGAVIAVLGAVGGVWVGGRISGNAARDAARVAAEAARQSALLATHVAEADREEARAARFAGRVRELAAQMLDSADRYTSACDPFLHLPSRPWQFPKLDDTFGQVTQELRLLVRLPETYSAIGSLELAMRNVPMKAATEWARGDTSSVPQTFQMYTTSVAGFEDAMRVELGRPSIQRPTASDQATATIR